MFLFISIFLALSLSPSVRLYLLQFLRLHASSYLYVNLYLHVPRYRSLSVSRSLCLSDISASERRLELPTQSHSALVDVRAEPACAGDKKSQLKIGCPA